MSKWRSHQSLRDRCLPCCFLPGFISLSLMKRRHFLHFAGSALAGVGLSQLDILLHNDKRFAQLSQRYGRVLAQPSGRKRALLVGINAYDRHQSGWLPLKGCVNDVRLQKALLVHRIGFDHSFADRSIHRYHKHPRRRRRGDRSGYSSGLP